MTANTAVYKCQSCSNEWRKKAACCPKCSSTKFQVRRQSDPNPKLQGAINRAIKRATKRASPKFDGLYGSLPAGTALLLSEIISFLRGYLLEERGFRKSQLRQIRSGTDEGVRVALGVLQSIGSALRIVDGDITLEGTRLTKNDAFALLFIGRHELRRLERQRSAASKGGAMRSEERKTKEHVWLEIGNALRKKHPQLSNAAIAQLITRAIDAPDVKRSVSTIRQALPKLGLGRKS